MTNTKPLSLTNMLKTPFYQITKNHANNNTVEYQKAFN